MNVAVSFVVVATGLSLAVWFARPLLAGVGLRGLRSTRLEQVLLALLMLAIVVLNLPLVAPGLFR